MVLQGTPVCHSKFRGCYRIFLIFEGNIVILSDIGSHMNYQLT